MKKYTLLALLFLSPITFASASGTLSLGVITPSTTVSSDTTISFQINSSGFHNPYYTLSDTFPGSTLANLNIDRNGKFNWTPSLADIGIHNVTINAFDSYGNSDSVSQTFTIEQLSRLSIQSLSPGTSVFPDNVLSFIVAARGFVNPSFYITDSFANSSLSSDNISHSGILTWSPKASDVGVHNLKISATSDNGTLVSIYQTLTVNGINIENISGTNLTIGKPLTFSIVNFGLTNPTYTARDSTTNNVLNDNLDGNQFSWTPQQRDVGEHVISIDAIDKNRNTANIKIKVDVTAAPSVYSNTTTNNPTVTKSTYLFTKPLNVGSSGTGVMELQKRLIAEGLFSGNATGYYGPLTKTAVQAFQRKHKLSPLGNVGPATRAALNAN